MQINIIMQNNKTLISTVIRHLTKNEFSRSLGKFEYKLII